MRRWGVGVSVLRLLKCKRLYWCGHVSTECRWKIKYKPVLLNVRKTHGGSYFPRLVPDALTQQQPFFLPLDADKVSSKCTSGKHTSMHTINLTGLCQDDIAFLLSTTSLAVLPSFLCFNPLLQRCVPNAAGLRNDTSPIRTHTWCIYLCIINVQ